MHFVYTILFQFKKKFKLYHKFFIKFIGVRYKK